MKRHRRGLGRLAAAVALVAGVGLALAPPASAHALLLRTEPAPQTTVKTAPSAVKLFFSEPVEVTFGAIRVFDVNGKRVDPGTLHKVGNGSEVDVPLTGIKDGTYTVTWRAVSADGHPVSGGFTFYVGAPSTISAVAIPSDQGAGRVVGWGFGVVRFTWFAGLLVLIGAIVTRRWAWTPAVRAAGLGGSEAAGAFRRRLRPVLLAAWVALAVTCVLALLFESASASGLSLLSAARPSVLNQVLKTHFGRLWLLQAPLTLGLAVPVAGLAAKRRRGTIAPSTWVWVALLLAAGLAADEGLNGHARTVARPWLGVASITVHLLSVAVWVGGLAVLVAVCVPAWRKLAVADRPSLVRQFLPRFSRLAAWAALVVVASGTVNALVELATPGDLWRLSYGRVILAKIALLGLALILAACHRWVTPRGLAATEPDRPAKAVGSLERTSRLEALLLAGAVAATAGLVVLVPGRTIALAASGPVNQTAHASGYVIQLYIDPTTVGANEFHVSFVTPQGLAAGEVANAMVTLAPMGGGPAPMAMRLISPGHFVGDGNLPAPGHYELAVNGSAGGTNPTTTFLFTLRQSKGSKG